MTSYRPPTFTIGRSLISLSSIACIAGPFLADFNETHVYNPNWPPHARFHNGQTMSMGAGLGLLTLFLAYRSAFAAPPASTSTTGTGSSLIALTLQKQDSLAAALVGSLYWVTGLSAILYPGALAMDPEFGGPDEFPQAPLFSALTGLVWIGYWLEGRRIERATKRVASGKKA